jgi:HNH endonuclease
LPSDHFSYNFNSILTKGRKDNTYKFALARFLVDYAYRLDETYIKTKLEDDANEIIEFPIIAKFFLEYYWHQICKYKIRQNHNMDKLPLIVQVIQSVFGNEYIPEPFESMDQKKVMIAKKMISKRCFDEVIPRFQNITDGIRVASNKVFYEFHDNSIEVKPDALQFFRENHTFLLKGIILEWAKFLEKINHGLPRLISKIEGVVPSRSSLEKIKSILLEYSSTCFYCVNRLSTDKQRIHVDHFIPWSFIFEDEIWNLVLACRNCNLKKHSSLPPEQFVKLLAERNEQYCDTMNGLKKSLLRLDPELQQERAIMKHYQNCMDYGFTVTQF